MMIKQLRGKGLVFENNTYKTKIIVVNTIELASTLNSVRNQEWGIESEERQSFL